jgi:DNA topoisomerase IA
MRVSFTAITRDAVRQAVENPRPLDMNLVAAQRARRKLDRLVGYLVSPIACRVLDGRYSAGRVQSPALRMVVERERAIEQFSPETYYTLDVLLGEDYLPADKPIYKSKANAQAVTSILSIRDDEAHLAPVATGDFERAYQTAEYLL